MTFAEIEVGQQFTDDIGNRFTKDSDNTESQNATACNTLERSYPVWFAAHWEANPT